MNNPSSKPTLTQEARALVASSRGGVLSTLMRDGTPYGSLVDFAPLPDGDILMFLSRLAEHQRNLERDPRVSILIAPSADEADALSRPRLTLVGKVEVEEDRDAMAAVYLAHFPGVRGYISFNDFQFYRLRVEKARYIAGFGRMGWITGRAFHTEQDE